MKTMKKIAVLSLFLMMFMTFSPSCYAITVGGCVPDIHVDDGGIVIGVIWGTAKGCWSAYWASEGSKWDSFVEAFK